jgi:hypothetical protein
MLIEGPSNNNTKREVELVEAGWHTGTVRWADEVERDGKVKIKTTLDLNDGRRCKFNIQSSDGGSVARAMGIPTPNNFLDPESLVDKQMTVNLKQYTHTDGKVYNVFNDIRETKNPVGSQPPASAAPASSAKPLTEGEIPF